jgi:hypothetical protein
MEFGYSPSLLSFLFLHHEFALFEICPVRLLCLSIFSRSSEIRTDFQLHFIRKLSISFSGVNPLNDCSGISGLCFHGAYYCECARYNRHLVTLPGRRRASLGYSTMLLFFVDCHLPVASLASDLLKS